MQIERSCEPLDPITFATSIAGSTQIPMEIYAGCGVAIAAVGGNSTLTWYASTDGVNFYPLYDASGNAATTPLAGTAVCFPIPPAAAPFKAVAAIADVANVAAALCRKS